MNQHFSEKNCKICNSDNFIILVDYGPQPLVHLLYSEYTLPPTYNLTLYQCVECTHVFSNTLYTSTLPIVQDDYIEWVSNHLNTSLPLITSNSSFVDKFKALGWKVDDKDGIHISLNEISYIHNLHEYIQSIQDYNTIVLQIPYIDINNLDTIYHGRVNYFNQSSLEYLLRLYNLHIIKFEQVTLHDTSFLVTIGNKSFVPYVKDVPIQFTKNVDQYKLEFDSKLQQYRELGYKIIGYGANIKCNVLVNLTNTRLDFIIDDDASRWGLYIPSIYPTQVYPPTKIINNDKIVIIPFSKKISLDKLSNNCIVFNPKTLREEEYKREKVRTNVIVHFKNEEYMLPYWLNHHKDLFDFGVFINYNSTDRSVEIIKEIVPNWIILNTLNPDFNPTVCDLEVMEVERQLEGWKIALNVTEFLCGNVQEAIHASKDDNRAICICCLPMFESIQYESNTPLNPDLPLIQQRTFGTKENFRRTRTMHCNPDGNYVEGGSRGRHWPKIHPFKVASLYEMCILWYNYSPCNEIMFERSNKVEYDSYKDEVEKRQADLIDFRKDVETSHHFGPTYLCWMTHVIDPIQVI